MKQPGIIANMLAAHPMVQRLFSGMSWAMAGNLGARVLTMIATICLARILTASEFGAYGLIMDTVATFGVLAGFRLGSTASRYIAAYREEDAPRAGRIVKLTNVLACVSSAAAALMAMAAAPLIAKTQLGNPLLTWPLIIAAAAMGFRLTGQVLSFTLAGFEDFKSVAMMDAGRGFATLILVVPCAFFFGLSGVFTGLLCVSISIMLASFARIRLNQERFSVPRCAEFAEAWRERSVLWSFALPGVLSGLMEMGALWQSRVLLGHTYGLESVGVFMAANQWRALVLFVPGIVGRVMMPMLSRAFTAGSKDFHSAVQVNLRFMWMLVLPMTVLMIGFSDLLAAAFGEKYAQSETIIPILMTSVFFYCVSAAARHVIDSAGKRWAVVAMTVVGAACMLAVTWLALPRFGASAPALGMLAGYGIILVLELIYIERVIARGQVVRRTGLYLLCVLILALSCWARYALNPIAATLCGAGLFGLALLPGAHVALQFKRGETL